MTCSNRTLDRGADTAAEDRPRDRQTEKTHIDLFAFLPRSFHMQQQVVLIFYASVQVCTCTHVLTDTEIETDPNIITANV